MKRMLSSGQHPSEGEMVRYLDGELSELEERRLRSHADKCGFCADRLLGLATDSSEISRFIARSNDSPPSMIARVRARSAMRRARTQAATAQRVVTRVAAVAGICVAIIVSADPLRAWIANRWDDSRAVPAVTQPSRVSPPLVDRVDPSRSRVAFTPRAPIFEMEVETLQADGTLTIRIGDAEVATAETVNGSQETILVLPEGIHIENQSGSVASYTITVPAHLEGFHLSVAGRSIAEIQLGGGAPFEPRSYSLSTGRRSQ